jgi:AcrR family transcriptional regulator
VPTSPPVPVVEEKRRPRRRPGRPTRRAIEGEPHMREQVLREARRLFLQRGYAGVAVGQVAAAVGVTKPTLYYYFADKEGLYAAVLCDLLRLIGGYVREVVGNEALSVRQRLFELAFGYFRYADATLEPVLRDTNELIGAQHARAVWAAYESEFFGPMRELMRVGMRVGELRELDPDVLVRAFLCLLDGFTAPGGHATRDDAEHRRIAEVMVALFADGAAPR